MFCMKCGNSLEDNARFCDKCGTSTMEVNNMSSVTVKTADKEIQFSVKPTYKSIYFMLGPYVGTVLAIIFFIVIGSIFDEVFLGFLIGLGLASFCLLIEFIYYSCFKKKQLNCMKYDFYKTKIGYTDSFLNRTEKEVKYKNIRECVLTRTISDRIFGFGRITLYTNAESDYHNGILIPFLEDSEAVYKKIMDILDN